MQEAVNHTINATTLIINATNAVTINNQINTHRLEVSAIRGDATYDGSTYIVFCTKWQITSPNGSEYTYNGDFIPQYKENRPEYARLAEMIYWGYTMKYGTGLPTTDAAYSAACATQQYVWEYIHNNIDSSFSYPSRDSWTSTYMSSSNTVSPFLSRLSGSIRYSPSSFPLSCFIMSPPVSSPETVIISPKNSFLMQ